MEEARRVSGTGEGKSPISGVELFAEAKKSSLENCLGGEGGRPEATAKGKGKNRKLTKWASETEPGIVFPVDRPEKGSLVVWRSPRKGPGGGGKKVINQRGKTWDDFSLLKEGGKPRKKPKP